MAAGEYLQRRGSLEEALGRVREGLAAVQDETPENTTLLCRLLLLSSSLHLDRFQFEPACAAAEEARELGRRQVNPTCQGFAANLLGIAAHLSGDFGWARGLFEKALGFFKEAGEPVAEAMVRSNMGTLEDEDPAGSAAAAFSALQQSLSLYRQAQYARGEAEALTNLGALAFDSGEPERAGTYYAEALQIEGRLRHPLGVARSLFNLGEVLEARSRNVAAARAFATAHHLFTEIGSPYRELVGKHLSQLTAQVRLAPEMLVPEVGFHRCPLEQLIDWVLELPPDS